MFVKGKLTTFLWGCSNMRKHAVRRTSRSRSKLLPRLILSAFLVVGAAHCFCRFDMSSQMETFFAHAWAEMAPQVTAQPGQPANGSQPFAAQPAGAPILVTIARNPFMAPSAITSKPLPVSPLPNHGAIPAKGGNGGGAAAPVARRLNPSCAVSSRTAARLQLLSSTAARAVSIVLASS
jgi:hypothetical protein